MVPPLLLKIRISWAKGVSYGVIFFQRGDPFENRKNEIFPHDFDEKKNTVFVQEEEEKEYETEKRKKRQKTPPPNTKRTPRIKPSNIDVGKDTESKKLSRALKLNFTF